MQFLNLESSFEGKDYVCDRLLNFLLGEASSGTAEKLSFQLMEALLYRVELNLFSGRMESALAILQVGRLHAAGVCWRPSGSKVTSPDPTWRHHDTVAFCCIFTSSFIRWRPTCRCFL